MKERAEKAKTKERRRLSRLMGQQSLSVLNSGQATRSYHIPKGDASRSAYVAQNRSFPSYFCGMSNDHHDSHEPEQNEIGGPVVFALFLFVIAVIAIGMMAS